MKTQLVLTRRQGEEILIDGGNIVIKVVEIKGGHVRLVVSAPRTTVVDRREVHERRKALAGSQPPAGV